MVKERVREGYIDSLRGISAAFVIVGHCISEILQTSNYIVTRSFEMSVYKFINSYLDLGKIGVIVFFCLSGWLIPNSLRPDRPNAVKNFIISRVFRLYPAYWASIPFAIFSIYYLSGKPVSAATVVANFTMIQMFIGYESVQSLYWTLQVEIIFYTLCVFMFLLGVMRNNLAIFCVYVGLLFSALVMAVARYLMETRLPVSLPLSLSVMIGAYIFRRYHFDGDKSASRYAAWALGIFLTSILPICLLAYNKDYGFDETWYRYFITYIASIFIFFVFTVKLKIEYSYFVFIGRISYSMYLFGTIARIFVWMAFGAVVSIFPAWMAIIVALLGAIAMGAAVYYAVERPAMAVGRRISSGSGGQILGQRIGA